MEYSQGPPYGAYQGPQYNDRAVSYNRPHVNGRRNGQGGYIRGHGNGERRQPPHNQSTYGSRYDYTRDIQDSWDDQSGHYANDGQMGYDNYQSKRQEERPYAQQSRQRPMRSQRNGNAVAGRFGDPQPKARMPNNVTYQQDGHDIMPSGYGDDQRYEDWNGLSQNKQYTSEQHYGYGDQEISQGTPAFSRLQPNDRQPHDYRAQQPYDEDNLPRYLNGGSHSTPPHHPLDKSHQAHYDPSGVAHTPNSRQHEPKLNMHNAGASTLPSRPKTSNDQLESPETLAWDNPFPTFPPKSRHTEVDTPYSAEGRDLLGPSNVQVRQSKDNRARPSISPNMPTTSGYERSKTMPAAISRNIPDSGLIPAEEHSSWQEPGAVSGYYGPQDKGYLPKEHDQFAPPRPQLPQKSRSDSNRWGTKDVVRPVQTYSAHQGLVSEESHGEIFDSYSNEVPTSFQEDPLQKQGNDRTSPYDEEMPQFGVSVERANHARGMTIEAHLQRRSGGPGPISPMSKYRDQPEGSIMLEDDYYAGNMPRSQSQPNYNERQPPRSQRHDGFDFGVPGPSERRPATSAAPNDHGGYNRRPPVDRVKELPHLRDPRQSPHNRVGPRPGPDSRHFNQQRGQDPRRTGIEPVQVDRYRLPPVQNERSLDDPTQRLLNKPSRSNLAAPTPPPQKPLPNPDALPQHPAPVRPGLGWGAHPGQVARPAPVRQYNTAPTDANPQLTSRKAAGPVTPQDLEGLRQKTLRSPNDSATQFLLAKKLVEAADVLIDERADSSTKKKNRDRYQSDALKIIKKLSALSHTEADFYYADCYSRGSLGLQPDIKEAFILYQKAAKANHAQAAYRVAVCCELGQEEGGGTKRDAVKAMQWYKRAATLGDVAAMYKMGVIQLKGLLGQAKDPRDAVTWLKRAAEHADKENPHALHELALLHEKPTTVDGIRQDEAYSRRLFTQAANLGYKFSQFRLGCAYEYGLLGCPVDPRQSIAWYSKAAVQEEHQSELALSGWYLTGSEGVLQQSDTEAYLWARKAAQAGLAKAEYAMGYFTEVGIGAPANLEDAKRWYWKSASQNFPKARDRLEDLRKGGGPKQKARVSRSNMKKQSDGECVIM